MGVRYEVEHDDRWEGLDDRDVPWVVREDATMNRERSGRVAVDGLNYRWTREAADDSPAGGLDAFAEWTVEQGRDFDVQYRTGWQPPWTVRWTALDGRTVHGQGETFRDAMADGMARYGRDTIERWVEEPDPRPGFSGGD